MLDPKLEVGTIVNHSRKFDWGPGKVLAVGGGGKVTVYFRDLEERRPGDAIKTIATVVVGLEIAAEQSDPMLDNLPPGQKAENQLMRQKTNPCAKPPTGARSDRVVSQRRYDDASSPCPHLLK